MLDGSIDYSTYTRDQLLDALSNIDRERYPLNLDNLQRELAGRPTPAPVEGAPRVSGIPLALRLIWTSVVIECLVALAASNTPYWRYQLVFASSLLLFTWPLHAGYAWARMLLVGATATLSLGTVSYVVGDMSSNSSWAGGLIIGLIRVVPLVAATVLCFRGRAAAAHFGRKEFRLDGSTQDS